MYGHVCAFVPEDLPTYLSSSSYLVDELDFNAYNIII